MFGFKIARIDGRSMEPMLADGTIALFRRSRGVEQGDVILVEHEEFGVIVKKAAEIAADGQIALVGLSPQSTSAERLGSVSIAHVLGVLVAPIPYLRWRK